MKLDTRVIDLSGRILGNWTYFILETLGVVILSVLTSTVFMLKEWRLLPGFRLFI